MLTQTYAMSSGQEARLEMPDLLAVANGDIDLPNEALADVFALIYRHIDSAATPMQQLLFDRARLRSLVALACLVQVEPRVVMDAEDVTDGAVHYRALSWGDLNLIYSFFRFGPPIDIPAAADSEHGHDSAAASPGDDLPPAAE